MRRLIERCKALDLRGGVFEHGSLVWVGCGRWVVSIGEWAAPGVVWGAWGYDCLYQTRALYPLIEVERYWR